MTNLVTKCKVKEEWGGGGGGVVTTCKVKEEWGGGYFVAQGDKPCYKV